MSASVRAPSRPSCFDCGQDLVVRPGVACRAMHLHDPSWRGKPSCSDRTCTNGPRVHARKGECP